MRKIELSVVMIGVAIMVPTIQVGHDVLAQEQKKQQPPHKNVRADIEKLVQELGSESGTKRETATKSLLKIGEEALPFLATAFKSPDLEVRRRAVVIHTRIYDTVQEKRTEQNIADAMAMGIDRYFEKIVKNRESLTKEDWKTLIALANYLHKDAVSKGCREWEWESADYLKYPVIKAGAFRDTSILTHRRVVAESASVSVGGNYFVICRDFVSAPQPDTSVVFTAGTINHGMISSNCIFVCSGNIEKSVNNGDVIVCRKDYGGTNLNGCAIVCFGNIRVIGPAAQNHIFCHGNVVLEGTVEDNVILATGDVTLKRIVRGNIISAQGVVKIEDMFQRKNQITKLEKMPVANVKFFTPKLLGADMIFESNYARVTKIIPNSVLSKAGILSGDKIVTIGKTKIVSDDALVTLLRRQSLEKESVFAIHRGDQEIQIKVRFHRSEN